MELSKLDRGNLLLEYFTQNLHSTKPTKKNKSVTERREEIAVHLLTVESGQPLGQFDSKELDRDTDTQRKRRTPPR